MRLILLFLAALGVGALTACDAEFEALDVDGDGYTVLDGDCDEGDPGVNPGAGDTWYDGVDSDCDGALDFDADGDGDVYDPQNGTGDCDDADPAVNSAAEEICDGIDNDCDGTIDGADAAEAMTWYADADSDGYPDPYTTETGCEQPSDYIEATGAEAPAWDCNDLDSGTHPGADERCDDEDDDCDDRVDEDAVDFGTWYADTDEDGYGDEGSPASQCEQPDGFVSDDTDCDDTSDDFYPGAPEYDCEDPNDYNCDGVVGYEDNDGDGYAACTECDDTNADVHPGTFEDCSTDYDDDCDGETNEINAANCEDFYYDADTDGYGAGSSTVCYCEPLAGLADNDADCDDTDGAIYPGATEYCGGSDEDCDGSVDEDGADDVITWYRDADSDGFRDEATTDDDCDQPTGYLAESAEVDCDDNRADVNPSASEYCEGSTDEDCDGTIDEDGAVDAFTWYADSDGDSYGDDALTAVSCDQPASYVLNDEDCDDGDSATYPSADEYCDDEDDDCDGSVDESDAADPAADAPTWYLDSDADAYGDPDETSRSCDQPSGYLADGTDCDDGNADANPGASEVCDGSVDEDCDDEVDEDGASDVTTWYYDGDGDGFGHGTTTDVDCDQPDGYVAATPEFDCDDTASATYPGADELCGGSDEDCDGTIDEDAATDALTWYEDADGDNYGDAGSTVEDCSQPDGYVSDATDCDDADAANSPGTTEICDGQDNDCDAAADESGASDASTWYNDGDSDGYGDAGSTSVACDQPAGYVSDATDCDDADAATYPGADEICDGSSDEDCDGSVDEDGAVDTTFWYNDGDSDGYGDSGTDTKTCDQPAGYVADATDCDDADAATFPGSTEYCGGADEDCDGTVDENGAADASTWYDDGDGDTFGDATDSVAACDQPSGYIADGTDCDDVDAGVHPGADETCDSNDEDCDGAVDEGATDPGTWYADADGDTFGDAGDSTQSCEQPSGYVAVDTDCDDASDAHYPGADESCDGDDDDCDGSVDESGAVDASTWYLDADGDTYGAASPTTAACDQPGGYAATGDDCDDGDSGVYPGALEICDGVDQNCVDGIADEGGSTWYADTDGDGFGDAADSSEDCDQPTGYVSDDTDCDDTDEHTFPGAGSSEDVSISSECMTDADGDGYGDDAATGDVTAGTDCDDATADVNPGEPEISGDGTDQNCDGLDAEGALDDLVEGDLVITEFIQNPSTVNDADGEWFEVYNASGLDVELEDLEVYDDGSNSFTVSGSLVVLDGDYVVFGINDNTKTNGGTPVDYDWGTNSVFALSNSDDEIYLAYGGTVFDAVLYDNGATFPDASGASSSLDDDLLSADDNGIGDRWCESTSSYGDGDLGTPGAANDDCGFTYISDDVQAILDANCDGCHIGGGSSGGVTLDDINDSVDTPSSDVPAMDLIEPGDTANSYIWHKLNDTQGDVGGAGGDMPPSGPLDSGDLAIIESWIDDGAIE